MEELSIHLYDIAAWYQEKKSYIARISSAIDIKIDQILFLRSVPHVTRRARRAPTSKNNTCVTKTRNSHQYEANLKTDHIKGNNPKKKQTRFPALRHTSCTSWISEPITLKFARQRHVPRQQSRQIPYLLDVSIYVGGHPRGHQHRANPLSYITFHRSHVGESTKHDGKWMQFFARQPHNILDTFVQRPFAATKSISDESHWVKWGRAVQLRTANGLCLRPQTSWRNNVIFRKTLRSNASSTSDSCKKDVLMMCYCLIYKSELVDHQIKYQQ